jgi:acyl-CoA thioesterase-1
MKYVLSLIVILLLAFGVHVYTSQDSNQYQTTQTNTQNTDTEDTIKIVAFGDSLTAGYGVDLVDSYPALLERKLVQAGYPVIIVNMGVSGETTNGGLERVDFVISQQPDIVILGLGANDMLRAIDPTITKNNLEKIIQKIQNTGIQVVLAGMESQITNGFAYKKQFDAIYKDLSRAYKLPLIPFFLKGVVLNKEYNIQDGIHPNKFGYEKIVNENVLPVMVEVLR